MNRLAAILLLTLCAGCATQKPATNVARISSSLVVVPRATVASAAAVAPAPVMRSVTLAWDASPSPDVAGYVICHGPESRSTYPFRFDVGNVTRATIALPAGRTNYVTVAAYDTSGMFSPYSNEIAPVEQRMMEIYAMTNTAAEALDWQPAQTLYRGPPLSGSGFWKLSVTNWMEWQ